MNKREGVVEWRTKDSIFSYISAHLDEHGKLTKAGLDLPGVPNGKQELSFAPGLKEAILGDPGTRDMQVYHEQLIQLMKRFAAQGDQKSDLQLYELIIQNDKVSKAIDLLVDRLIGEAIPTEPFLFNYVKDLATQSDNVQAVKFGIAVLGLCQDKSILDVIKMLGRHDEFTVYAVVAMLNLSEDPVSDLWELGQKVDGWGKIQVVERLVQFELADAVKEWLLLEGYKNSVMYEYLAYRCAVKGELHKRLAAAVIGADLFKAAEDITLALLSEHTPREDISAYPFGRQVIEDFIRHAATHAQDVSDFMVLQNIKEFLTALDLNGDQEQLGWTQDRISNCLLDIIAILENRDWMPAVQQGLTADDTTIYWNAKQAALRLGVDLSQAVWERLIRFPLHNFSWYDVKLYVKGEAGFRFIDFALQNLPLEQLATGAEDSNGAKEDYHKNVCLEYATAFLENYPGQGERIVLTALRNAVTHNRNTAIQVLKKWERAYWSKEIEKELLYLSKREPNEKTRDSVIKLLNGQAIN